MARSGVRYAEFFAIEDKEEASSKLKSYGARIENKAASDWLSVRDKAIAGAHDLQTQLEADGTHLILASEPDFPPSLNDLSDPPAWLFVRGDVSLLRRASLTIVGTRTPSEEGLWLARYVGLWLGTWAAPTVSGLATGVDQVIHEMSLLTRVPTIAILGTGIFSEYPKGSGALRERIIESGGAVVTEYLPRESYSAENFVRRNRLQAALGRVLIPIEWAAKSGTAHTVRYAGLLKRPIAGIRLPHWPKDRVTFPTGAGETASVFTIPQQGDELSGFVAATLKAEERSQPVQLSLI
jgi:DNA protecting protein DprA